jgi:hypothetical protein
VFINEVEEVSLIVGCITCYTVLGTPLSLNELLLSITKDLLNNVRVPCDTKTAVYFGLIGPRLRLKAT